MSLFPQTDMAKEYGELCKKNVKVSRKGCWLVISQAFASLEKALNNGSYMRSGGYEDFRCELDRGAQLYRSEKRKGVMVSSTESVCACVLQETN